MSQEALPGVVEADPPEAPQAAEAPEAPPENVVVAAVVVTEAPQAASAPWPITEDDSNKAQAATTGPHSAKMSTTSAATMASQSSTKSSASHVMSRNSVEGEMGCEASIAAEKANVNLRQSATGDVQDILAQTGGQIPEAWQDDTIGAAHHYGKGSFITAEVSENRTGRFTQSQKNEAETLNKLRETNLASSELVADAMAIEGANPYAVASLGQGFVKNFRIKSFALICIQVITVLFLGIIIDMGVSDDKHPGTYFVGGLCLLLVIVLLIVAGFRHFYPFNYFMEVIFTLVAGLCLGLSSKPMERAQEVCCPNTDKAEKPGIYAFGFYVAGLCILSVICVLAAPGNKSVMKCLPCAFIADCFVVVLFGATWTMTKFCPINWLMCMMFVVCMCILWVGFECDRLANKLKIDEYLMPVILVWADLLVMIAICLAIIALIMCAAMGGGNVDCGGMCYGCHGCGTYSPWLHSTSGVRDRAEEAVEEGAAPQPQTMGQTPV